MIFLEGLGINPKKALSQNFLIDGNIIRKIVKEGQIGPEDLILEIGPGPGCLTEILLETGAKVIAVEKDFTLAAALKRLKGDLQVFCEDILQFPLENYFSEAKKGKVIANLPYNIATAILTKLVVKNHLLSRIIVMVQEEVARRITAKPGSKDYGSLTLFLNYYSSPRYAFKVSRNCFFPVPNVESAIVELVLKAPTDLDIDEDRFFHFVRTAFAQRRKMLKSSLKKLYPLEKIEEGLSGIGISSQVRPEELSLEEFIHLFKRLS